MRRFPLNGLAIAGSGGVVPPSQPLRFASATNFLQQGFASSEAAKRHVISRQPHFIGTADMSELRIILLNWANGSTIISTPGASVTYPNIYICKLLAGSGVNVKFSGSNSVTLADGQQAAISDAILPSQFGLTKFTVGERYDVTIDLPFSGSGFPFPVIDPVGGGAAGYDSGFFGLICDPTTTTYDNINSYGSINWTGPDVGVGNTIPSILVGRFVTGDHGVFMGIGDSIVAGVGAASRPGAGGGSFFTRSLFATDLNTAVPVAGLNAGYSGGVSDVWNNVGASKNNLAYLTQYANRFVEEYGINSIGGAGGAGAATAIRTASQGIYTTVRANAPVANGLAIKIMRTTLLAKTDATGLVPSAGCGLGDTLDFFNQQVIAAAVGAPGADVLVNMRNAVVANTNPTLAASYQWAATMTADGTHPTEVGHIALAGATGGVRAWIQANL